MSATLQFAVALPELTLAIGAMVLLMVGVATRKEQAELAEFVIPRAAAAVTSRS